MAHTKISLGDSDYSDIHSVWVTNGRPGQFDREGSFGGAIYVVHDTSLANPDFYRIASMGPTEFDDSTGNVTDKGWHLVNEDRMRLRFKVGVEGELSVERPEMPDEL